MNFFKMRCFILLFFLSITLSCQQSNIINSQQAAQQDTLQNPAPLTLQDHFVTAYHGTINNQYPILLTLVNWADGTQSGWYKYDRIGKRISLEGSVNLDESFEWNEFDESYNSTGKFQGRFDDLRTIEGRWINADSTKQFPFKLDIQNTADTRGWSGSWHLNDAWDDGLLIIGNVSADSFDFGLNILRNTHFGSLIGTAKINGQSAEYQTVTFDEESPCHFTFQLNEDHIILDQKSGNAECGFGMRAYAGGRYDNKSIDIKPAFEVGDDESNIFKKSRQLKAFKTLVGDYIETFAFNMWMIQYDSLQTIQKDLQAHSYTGGVPGLYTINEAIIIYTDDGKFWAATIDNDVQSDELVVRYFTTEKNWKNKLPKPIEKWRKNFENYPVIYLSK